MTASISLPKYIINRIGAFRLRPEHQRVAKTNLFNFFWQNSVPCNVLDSFIRPKEIVNLHRMSLPDGGKLNQEIQYGTKPIRLFTDGRVHAAKDAAILAPSASWLRL